MMYDELIRQMRACCNGEPCEEVNCGFNPKSDLDCIEQLLTRGADAIEELVKKYLASEIDNTNLTGWLAEEHAKHLWIPVEKRLPNYLENVLVTDGVFSGMGWRDYYDEPKEDYWISPYANVNDLSITHWMPLPLPPEEK